MAAVQIQNGTDLPSFFIVSKKEVMQKRFIAYFLGMILATLTLQAQELKVETPEPCNIIPNTQIDWGEVKGHTTFLKCGCELAGQYYLATEPDGQIHFNLVWCAINDHGTGCTNHKGCLIPNIFVDVDDVGGIENYFELAILDYHITFNAPQQPITLISSYRASCKRVENGFDYPGGIFFLLILKKLLS